MVVIFYEIFILSRLFFCHLQYLHLLASRSCPFGPLVSQCSISAREQSLQYQISLPPIHIHMGPGGKAWRRLTFLVDITLVLPNICFSLVMSFFLCHFSEKLDGNTSALLDILDFFSVTSLSVRSTDTYQYIWGNFHNISFPNIHPSASFLLVLK